MLRQKKSQEKKKCRWLVDISEIRSRIWWSHACWQCNIKGNSERTSLHPELEYSKTGEYRCFETCSVLCVAIYTYILYWPNEILVADGMIAT